MSDRRKSILTGSTPVSNHPCSLQGLCSNMSQALQHFELNMWHGWYTVHYKTFTFHVSHGFLHGFLDCQATGLFFRRWHTVPKNLVDGFYVAISEVADLWEGFTLRSDASNEFSCCCRWHQWFSKRGSLAGTVTCIWCLQGPTTSCEELPTVLLSEYSSGAPFWLNIARPLVAFSTMFPSNSKVQDIAS